MNITHVFGKSIPEFTPHPPGTLPPASLPHSPQHAQVQRGVQMRGRDNRTTITSAVWLPPSTPAHPHPLPHYKTLASPAPANHHHGAIIQLTLVTHKCCPPRSLARHPTLSPPSQCAVKMIVNTDRKQRTLTQLSVTDTRH